MSRWRELVGNLLTDLATETPGAHGFRRNIDHKIWEAEQKVSKTVPTTPYETPVRRLHGFQHELIETCQRRSKNASAGRSKNTSAMLARRPPNWGPFVRHQTWAGLSAGVSELARRERLLL